MADLYRVSELPTMADVPESQRRRYERDAKLLEEKKAAIAQLEKHRAEIDEALKKRTIERYEAKKAAEAEMHRLKAEAKANGGFYKPAEPKVLFVIRLKGVNKLAPKPRKVFQLFRLLQLHNGAFIKINKATMQMLKHIEPFVAYGYPSEETIRKLILKRGYLREGRMGAYQRHRIQDNAIISEKLGHLGIHGVEDMVHEIATCGPHFKEVNSFLWTFKLTPPRGGFVCKRHGFNEFRKGDWGNRENHINQLIRRML